MSHVFPVHGAFRTLWASEKEAYLAHLKRLSMTDRRLRFHCAQGDEALARHVDTVFERDVHIIGWFVGGVLRGACEVALEDLGVTAPQAEAAFTVESRFRGRGIGHELMHRAILYARNHGAEMLHIDTEAGNQPMLKLANAHGLSLERSQSDVAGVLRPAPATVSSRCLEVAEEEVGLITWALAAFRRLLGRWSERAFRVRLSH
ncbi:MAG: GNAT family N-acetyltransferase [Pseudomonadota bacterium]